MARRSAAQPPGSGSGTGASAGPGLIAAPGQAGVATARVGTPRPETNGADLVVVDKDKAPEKAEKVPERAAPTTPTATPAASPVAANPVTVAANPVTRPHAQEAPHKASGPSGLDDELRELKKEVEGSRSLTIKTHNLIGQLSAEVKQVSQRQDRYERGLSLNSFVAYVLFTLLLGGAFALLYRSRASGLVLERDTARQERDAAKDHDKQTETTASARAIAQEKARQYYELIASGKKSEVIAGYSEVARLALSPVEAAVFRAAVEEAKSSQTTSEFNLGKDAWTAQSWKKAVAAFRRAMQFEAPGPRMNEIHYYLGASLYHLGEYQDAASNLDAAQQASIERGVGADVDYYLAASYDMLRQLDKAKALYERYFSRHEGTILAKLARRRLIALSQAKGTAPPLTP